MSTATTVTTSTDARPRIEALVYPSTPAEFINVFAHYRRAEIGRMAGWRDRMDRTTNWAITVVAAMLSLSLSTPTAHHGVLLFAMLLVALLLMIEARRYRFFDVCRARVRRVRAPTTTPRSWHPRPRSRTGGHAASGRICAGPCFTSRSKRQCAGSCTGTTAGCS